MSSRILGILAALFGASPAMAMTLAHPDLPIFKACAVDMNVSGEVVADRILSVGWAETSPTPELKKLGQDHSVMNNFGNSVAFGEDTKGDWDARIDELSEILHLDPYEHATAKVRAFQDPDRSGFAVLTSEPDGFWSCEILLTAVPFDGSRFMAVPPSNGDQYATDGITYMSDQDGRSELVEFLGLLPFMPTPERYYLSYVFIEPETIEARYRHSVSLVFAAEFSTIFPY